jgi:hypothetical protein
LGSGAWRVRKFWGFTSRSWWSQAIRKRQEEEAKRRLEELQAAQINADSKFASLDEEIIVGRER